MTGALTPAANGCVGDGHVGDVCPGAPSGSKADRYMNIRSSGKSRLASGWSAWPSVSMRSASSV